MPKAGCRGLHYLAFPFTHYPIRHTHRGRTNTHRILLIWTHSGLNFHLAEMHGHTARFLHRSCEIVLYWLFWILRQRRIYKNIQDVTSFLLFKKKGSRAEWVQLNWAVLSSTLSSSRSWIWARMNESANPSCCCWWWSPVPSLHFHRQRRTKATIMFNWNCSADSVEK